MCETPLFVRNGSYTKQMPLEHLSHIKQMPLEHLSYIKKTSWNKAVHKVERSSLTVTLELLKVWKSVTRFINGSAGASICYNYDFASWVVPFTSIAPVEGGFVSSQEGHKTGLCRRTLSDVTAKYPEYMALNENNWYAQERHTMSSPWGCATGCC